MWFDHERVLIWVVDLKYIYILTKFRENWCIIQRSREKNDHKSGVIRTTLTFLQNIEWRKMRLKFWNFLPSLQCVPITLEQRVKMQYCQKLIRFHHIRLYLDLNLCNEDLLAKICKNVKILCTTPPMATTGTVTHTTLTFLQTCKNVKVVCVTPFIGSKNVKVWHYINFARMWRFGHITLT